MPTVPTVLITGITGFLAAHVALRFLRAGWVVRGTLRSSSKLDAVISSPFFVEYAQSGMLTLHVTGPLESGDYAGAMHRVDAVCHVASPVEFQGQDFRNDFLAPAVDGTKGVLEAAAKEESVKAVVMTSTYGAVGNHRTHPHTQNGRVLTEADWNPYTLEELDEISRSGVNPNSAFLPGYLFYMGAKKYAELTAWEVQKATGSRWSLATMNCAMIFGPPIQPMTSLSHGGMSTEWLYALTKGKDVPIGETLFPYYGDVRDIADAHYQAVVRNAQGRFNIAQGTWDLQQIADLVREQFPDKADRIALGTPGTYGFNEPGVYVLDCSKSVKELGVVYRPIEETVHDAFARFFELEAEGLH